MRCSARWPVLLLAGLAACFGAGCAIVPESGVSATVGPISDHWTIQWNDALGTPARMINRSLQDVQVSRSTPAPSDSAARAAVQAVLWANAQWFRLRPGVDALEVTSTQASEWMRIVRLQQVYRGVPVAGAGYEARVFPNGRVASFEGRFQPDIDLSVTPSYSEQQVVSQAKALFIGGAIRDDVPVLRLELERLLSGRQALAILSTGERLALAWAVTVEPSPREVWRVYINAITGEVLGRQQISGNWR